MEVPAYFCNQVKAFDAIGWGSFGTVYEEIGRATTVAVKINTGEDWESAKEVKRMKWLQHPNIIALLGTVPTEYHGRSCKCVARGLSVTTTWILMEYMPFGNLRDYILKYPGGIPAHGMMKIAFQVANGMWYLHRYANTIHKDLAARNVLVQNNNFNVKIGDFGFNCDYDSESHYYQDENGKPCPIRWMAPENLPNSSSTGPRYTRKGDVWSFGVLLFEIWSRGRHPFNEMMNEDVMDAVSSGETVLNYFNLQARNWVINLMYECFEYNKRDRPNFRMIADTIQEGSQNTLK